QRQAVASTSAMIPAGPLAHNWIAPERALGGGHALKNWNALFRRPLSGLDQELNIVQQFRFLGIAGMVEREQLSVDGRHINGVDSRHYDRTIWWNVTRTRDTAPEVARDSQRPVVRRGEQRDAAADALDFLCQKLEGVPVNIRRGQNDL